MTYLQRIISVKLFARAEVELKIESDDKQAAENSTPSGEQNGR